MCVQWIFYRRTRGVLSGSVVCKFNTLYDRLDDIGNRFSGAHKWVAKPSQYSFPTLSKWSSSSKVLARAGDTRCPAKHVRGLNANIRMETR